MSQPNKEIFDFYEWFFVNADFGPAHEDVVFKMLKDYEIETGKYVPDEVADGIYE